jgi:hypothetical protein
MFAFVAIVGSLNLMPRVYAPHNTLLGKCGDLIGRLVLRDLPYCRARISRSTRMLRASIISTFGWHNRQAQGAPGYQSPGS